MIHQSEVRYGRSSGERLKEATLRGIEGARAILETFYYAFNHRDTGVFERVWAEHKLIQLNNPLGGIRRGYEPIASLYRGIFDGPAKVWVDFFDIVEFGGGDTIVFAGREEGEFSVGDVVLPLSIRTSRVMQWLGPEIGWRQTHHHGSIDDPAELATYQDTVMAP